MLLKEENEGKVFIASYGQSNMPLPSHWVALLIQGFNSIWVETSSLCFILCLLFAKQLLWKYSPWAYMVAGFLRSEQSWYESPYAIYPKLSASLPSSPHECKSYHSASWCLRALFVSQSATAVFLLAPIDLSEPLTAMASLALCEHSACTRAGSTWSVKMPFFLWAT